MTKRGLETSKIALMAVNSKEFENGYHHMDRHILLELVLRDGFSFYQIFIGGKSVSIPITNGQLNLGTWQGIYLCEFRNRGGRRKLVVTVVS
jgi:thiamine phosphate synthase YjbQ (UPF0047 family)